MLESEDSDDLVDELETWLQFGNLSESRRERLRDMLETFKKMVFKMLGGGKKTVELPDEDEKPKKESLDSLIAEARELNEMSRIANTIWKQIPMSTKMAIGARQPKVSKDGKGLLIKVLRTARYVEVTLLPNDTYDVEFFRVKRNDYSRVVLAKVGGIYADQLGETLYGITHGKIH